MLFDKRVDNFSNIPSGYYKIIEGWKGKGGD